MEQPVTNAAVPPADAATEVSPQRLRSLARAAQHEILRRLAPPLRHDMVVHLQSLGLMAEALGARAERGAVGREDLQSSVSKLNRLARQATARCLDVCTWMEPGEDDRVALRAGVLEVVGLLSTSLNFRGFELRTELAEGEVDVPRSALRFLLCAAILTLADAAPGPGVIAVHAGPAAAHGRVDVVYEPQAEGSFTQPHAAGSAPLAWPEVQALALQHGAALAREGQAIHLRLPRSVVTTALKMAPV
jgi:hypothetical protein